MPKLHPEGHTLSLIHALTHVTFKTVNSTEGIIKRGVDFVE